MNVFQLWWLSLGIGAVVIVVVAILLGLIIATAKSIDRTVHAIWVAGKQIAGNTVTIWTLEKTNEDLANMVEAIEKMDHSVSVMDERLRGVPGTASGGR